MNLNAVYDAMEVGSLAILYRLTGEDEKAAEAFTKAHEAVNQLGPLSITGQALRVTLEDAQAAEVEVLS